MSFDAVRDQEVTRLTHASLQFCQNIKIDGDMWLV